MQNQADKQITNISSNAENPVADALNNYTGVIQKLENVIAKDTLVVQDLIRKGVINQQQGRGLILQLAQKLNEINTYKNSQNDSEVHPAKQVEETTSVNVDSNVNYLDLFQKENPEFFKGDGRNAVFDYIKNLNMDKDEIAHIAKLVESLENSAVDSYMRKTAHEKSLNDENAIAKSKLTAYAQNTNSGNDYDRIFTREDIGNMNGDEFNKNELLIMEQIKKGLIK